MLRDPVVFADVAHWMLLVGAPLYQIQQVVSSVIVQQPADT